MTDKTLYVIGENGIPVVLSREDVERAARVLQQLAGVAMSRGFYGMAQDVSNGARVALSAFVELTK